MVSNYIKIGIRQLINSAHCVRERTRHKLPLQFPAVSCYTRPECAVISPDETATMSVRSGKSYILKRWSFSQRPSLTPPNGSVTPKGGMPHYLPTPNIRAIPEQITRVMVKLDTTLSSISLLIWYIGVSMGLISIFEFAKSSLYGITRYRQSKIVLKVKHHYVCNYFA